MKHCVADLCGLWNVENVCGINEKLDAKLFQQSDNSCAKDTFRLKSEWITENETALLG